MKQSQFIARHEQQWEQFERWIDEPKNWQGTKKTAADQRQPEIDDFDFPERYRQVCRHLALARSRQYSQILQDRLESLVLRGHQIFYRKKDNLLKICADMFLRKFPQTFRREWRLVSLSALLLFGPFFALLYLIQIEPSVADALLDQSTLREMESMYDPSEAGKLGTSRGADSDILMFGYYIWNNTSIGFRTFAGGLLFGFGTLFTLVFNGTYFGVVAGHLTHVGYIKTFWGFVSGHSAPELMAIVISGTAGFKLAAALFRPGRKSRARALRDNAKVTLILMTGAASLFILAAFIEAFWSPRNAIPAEVKYAVGVFNWCLLLAYLLFTGRGRQHS